MAGTGRACVLALMFLAAAAPASALEVTSTADSGPGTLRQALLDANAAPGPDTITLAAGEGATVALAAGLPEVGGPVLIDGTRLRVDGAATAAQDGLRLLAAAAGSVIQALSFERFAAAGLRIAAADVEVTGVSADGNGGSGVSVSGHRATLRGVTLTGNGVGVRIAGGAGSRIEGTAAQPTRIAGNRGAGVDVRTGTGHTITGAQVVANGGLAIDLGGDGVTANADDAWIDMPVLESALGEAMVTLRGHVHPTGSGGAFRLEVFAADAGTECDPSYHGELGTLLSTAEVEAGPFALPVAVPGPGTALTATLTDLATGDTSEAARVTGAGGLLGSLWLAAAGTASGVEGDVLPFVLERTCPADPLTVLLAADAGHAADLVVPGPFTLLTGTRRVEGTFALARDDAVEGDETAELGVGAAGALLSGAPLRVAIRDATPRPVVVAASVNRPPSSRIVGLARRARFGFPRTVRGTAGDPEGRLAAVQVAVLGETGAGRRRRCIRITSTGRVRRSRPRRGRCLRTYVNATGTRRWRLLLRDRLPPGRYEVRSRAIDELRLVERPVAGHRLRVVRR